jgi:hypothetical protein
VSAYPPLSTRRRVAVALAVLFLLVICLVAVRAPHVDPDPSPRTSVPVLTDQTIAPAVPYQEDPK